MTSIVGVLCKDGAVIGTDSSVTFQSHRNVQTIEQPADKIEIIDEHVIIAGTGSVGLGQRFGSIVKKAWEGKFFKGSNIDLARDLCQHTIKDFASTQVAQGTFGALVAFPLERKHYLCEFSITDFQPEFKTEQIWYCSMGCAQSITDPFLGFIRDVFWSDGLPNLEDALFAVTWTLDHAIALNPGGVNGPVRIAVLESTKNGLKARLVDESELEEHRQSVEEAKNRLRGFRNSLHDTSAESVPAVPKLES